MEIVHVQVEDSRTAARSIRSTTAGLTTGYQRTGNTTVGASAVATAGGYVLVPVASLMWHSPILPDEPSVEMGEKLELGHNELAAGYRAMSSENSLLAEESLPAALEVWPAWEE